MTHGAFNTPVKILQRSAASDPLNQPQGVWTVSSSIWGDVRFQNGLQRLSADQLHTKAKVSVRVRQTSCSRTILKGMRMRINGSDYDIIDTLLQGRAALDLVGQGV
jgi:SPP1 family predicted phage head-tail adaptor